MSERQYECGLLLASVDSLHRTKVLETLLGQRVIAKSQRVMEIWQRSNKDWNQVLYAMAAYALCAPRNSAPAQRLAEVVPFAAALRERSSRQRVEALLLGASGLLEGEYFDSYIVALQEEFDYLANKYSLCPMKAGEWQKSKNLPAGNPVVRLVQLAALVSKPEFAFDALVGCKTLADVERLLEVEVSEYWQKHFTLQGESCSASKRIGRSKVAMMAINMVVPLQIAYADTMRDARLKESALEMLDTIPAESNRVVGRWTGVGIPCRSAYDSQALLELQSLCERGACGECPVEKQLRK